MPESLPSKVKNELNVARSVFRPTRLQHSLDSVAADLSATVDRLSAAELRSEALGSTLTELHQHVTMLTEVVHATNVATMIERSTHWASIAPIAAQATISVVMPTHNRSGLLRSAAASVLAQSYAEWQLIIIDDGSEDDTPEVIAELAASDDRIMSGRTTGVGPADARNAGLELVTGSIVTFLDDDNLMMPHWLRGVAEFTGRIADMRSPLRGAVARPARPEGDASINTLFVSPFDEALLRRDNYIDLGALAVRAGHPQLHFNAEYNGLETGISPSDSRSRRR